MLYAVHRVTAEPGIFPGPGEYLSTALQVLGQELRLLSCTVFTLLTDSRDSRQLIKIIRIAFSKSQHSQHKYGTIVNPLKQCQLFRAQLLL